MRISDWSSDVCSSDLIALLDLRFSTRCPAVLASRIISAAGRFSRNFRSISYILGAFGYAASLSAADRSASETGTPARAIWRKASREIGRASCRERVWQYV